MLFTHQGADWQKDSPWGRVGGVPFPSSVDDPAILGLARQAKSFGDAELERELTQLAREGANAASIDAEFAALAQWCARHGAPAIVNEFGVLKGKVKPAHRLAWLQATRRAAESHGVGWTHWDYAQGFGLLDDSGAPDMGVIHALLMS
jgi:endoglucanase